MTKTKRVYEEPSPEDGFRILVDRIWPRGLSKQKARIDWWPKEIAPSTELRKWFAHEPARWHEFRHRYFLELNRRQDLVKELQTRAAGQKVTLLYGAKDRDHNNAVCLAEYLEQNAARLKP